MIHSHYQPRPSKPTIDLGGTCHHQAWYLRRLMSMYNDITRRVHLPRELAIRRIMAATGVIFPYMVHPPVILWRRRQ